MVPILGLIDEAYIFMVDGVFVLLLCIIWNFESLISVFLDKG